MKYKLESPKEDREFLKTVYADVRRLEKDGAKGVCLVLNGVLEIDTEVNGIESPTQRVSIEIHLTNIDALGDDMAVTLGSMLYSLIDENNLREFEYSASELSVGLLGNAGEFDCERKALE